MSPMLELCTVGRPPLHKHLHEGSDWAGYGLGAIGPALNSCADGRSAFAASLCAEEPSPALVSSESIQRRHSDANSPPPGVKPRSSPCRHAAEDPEQRPHF